MRKRLTPFILGLFLALTCLPPLHAQNAPKAPPDTSATPENPAPANAAPAGQAPDDVTNKVADLVHAGKYAEARQLTSGLLLAYPNDQRLIKAKALLETAPATPGSANATAGGNQPASNPASAQPAPNAYAEQLTGMDKVDYNALIELERQAQQTTDLPEQKQLQQQFMSQSGVFLQKYPGAVLLWQLRAASAIGLNDPTAGYEAGEQLLAMGAADSNDPNLQRLLAQLKNKGWLDKQKVEEEDKLSWIVGTWSVSWSYYWKAGVGARLANPLGGSVGDQGKGKGANEEFVINGTGIDGYRVTDGVRDAGPDMKGTVLDSGEISWERYFSQPGGGSYVFSDGGSDPAGRTFYPSGWQPVISSEIADDKSKMTMVIPSQDSKPASKEPMKRTVNLSFERADRPQETHSDPVLPDKGSFLR